MQMMYALVHYPNVDTRQINQLRMKYDPQAALIEPHITLMFPVPEAIEEDRLVRHLQGVLADWRSFPIHLQDVQVSSDDHLFLLIQEGNSSIIRLHDEIYTGLVADYLRKDLPFVPHLTLGVLGRDLKSRQRALEEARQMGIDAQCVFDRLSLVKVNADRSAMVWSREFSFT